MKRTVLVNTLLGALFASTPLMASAKSAKKPAARMAADQNVRQSVDAFNQKDENSCRKMDNPAAEALWADDGVDLIPGMQPMVGKAAISKWLDGLTAQLHGAKMDYCTIDWRGIKIQGDWVYEWGITRQKIEFPPPQKSFENEGKMLLILKRQQNGSWKIELESWNSSPGAGK